MPLFEYTCRQCDHRFEALVRGGTRPECPACRGTSLDRQLSVFAAHTNGAGSRAPMPAAGACGRCGDPRGPGACALN
jgi:putative FmdB family regulatory protein